MFLYLITYKNNKRSEDPLSRFRIPPFRFRVYHLTATKPPNSEYKYVYIPVCSGSSELFCSVFCGACCCAGNGANFLFLLS